MHESEKSKWSRSVVSNSSRPHGLQPTRLLRPWDFPGKSTGVGCHCLTFSKSSLNIWYFLVPILLKPGLEDFEHYFASMGNECNCVVFWTFFGIALLWDWNENWPFPVLWPPLSFQICQHTECSTFTVSSFRTWNSSAGIPSPPLALFVLMLPKVQLTLHSKCLSVVE